LFGSPALAGVVIFGLVHESFWGRVFGAAATVFGMAILAAVLMPLRRALKRRRGLGQRDAVDMQVERIEVEWPRAALLEPSDDHQDPALCLQIGDDTLLLLVGQWLRDPAVFGAKPPREDPLEDRVNGLADPRGFPSTAFVIERLPHSGTVLRIVVTGPYLDPVRVHVDLLKPDYDFGDSALIRGTLDALGDALAAAHSRGR
jgi:hypothetical protein